MARGGAVVRTPVRTARESQSSSASKPSSTPPPAPAVMGVDIDVGCACSCAPSQQPLQGLAIHRITYRTVDLLKNELMRI
eukprot:SAG25_NODE_130_length_14421_cov_71.473886_7_plen_80_part_00